MAASSASSTGGGSLSDWSTADLLEELRRRYHHLKSYFSEPTKNLIFVGAPGSGKGTQSSFLKEKYHLCHLATGDLLRNAVKTGSAIGKIAKTKMDAGELVEDSIVISLIEEEIEQPQCQKGFVLDGFPRNIPQAEALDEMLKKKGKHLDGVFHFDIADDVLVERIAGRRVHPSSGRVYHTKFNPPKVDGKDDVTGEPLIQRSDDNEETLRKRLTTFHRDTIPILQRYSRQGITHTIEATQKPRDLSMEIETIISNLRKETS